LRGAVAVASSFASRVCFDACCCFAAFFALSVVCAGLMAPAVACGCRLCGAWLVGGVSGALGEAVRVGVVFGVLVVASGVIGVSGAELVSPVLAPDSLVVSDVLLPKSVVVSVAAVVVVVLSDGVVSDGLPSAGVVADGVVADGVVADGVVSEDVVVSVVVVSDGVVVSVGVVGAPQPLPLP